MNEMLKTMKRVKKIGPIQKSTHMYSIHYPLTLNDFLWVNHTEPLRPACHLPCGLVSTVMCRVIRTRQLQYTQWVFHSHTCRHSNTQLSGLLRTICLEHICQCSIKNPSDKRFKWMPLWVMSSCLSEEAFTAQQMKTDEKDHPLRLDIRASAALMQMHAQQRCIYRSTLPPCLLCITV